MEILLQKRLCSLILLLGLSFLSVSVDAAEGDSASLANVGASVTPFVLKGGVSYEVTLPDNELSLLNGHRPLLLGGAMNASISRTPVAKIPFSLNGEQTGGKITLTIGSIRGINTREAHRAGQSQAMHVSSPTTIKVNGKKVGFVYTNENEIPMHIPAAYLRADGMNVLQIEAGYYLLPGNEVAYDQVEIHHLGISY